MRILLCLFVCSTIAGVLLLFFPTERTVHEIEAIPLPSDLGVVAQGTKAAFAITLQNNTSSSIEIVDSSVSCGCTILDEIRDTYLLPFQSKKVSGFVETRGKRGPTSIHIIFMCKTRESEESTPVFTDIVCFVKPTILTKPQEIAFALPDRRAAQSTALTRHIYLSSDILDRFSLTHVESSASWLTARIVKPAFLKQSTLNEPADIEVTFDPKGFSDDVDLDSNANSSQNLTVSTSADKEPLLVIPVEITVERRPASS